MADLLKFSIPGNPDYVQMVRLAVASAASHVNFDVESIDDIEVALSEACKNITCHGHDGFSSSYEVICEVSEEKIIITVADNSGGKHNVAKDKKPCRNCPTDGDMAIIVMESLMDEAEIVLDENGNKAIRMVKNKC